MYSSWRLQAPKQHRMSRCHLTWLLTFSRLFHLYALPWSMHNMDMFVRRVAIPGDSTACLRRNLGKPAVDTPAPVSSGHHTWDSDPLSAALDLRDHTLPFLRRTTAADEHHRIPVSSDPFQGGRSDLPWLLHWVRRWHWAWSFAKTEKEIFLSESKRLPGLLDF